ncbi:MAG: AAA family ATPase, partial [Bacteroidetes bacterium]|nr:AAA family ATPase [Bacteroidota bacterium]
MDDIAPVFDPAHTVVGHEIFTDALSQAIDHGRVAHGWLLTGPQGIGKGIMARMAAAWLMAEQRSDGNLDFDGKQVFAINPDDPGSNLVIKSAHPDLMVIEPDLEDNKSGQIKLDQIRKLLGFMAHKPARGGWRVAIVDSMDQVNRNGANALLKVLEEPPEKTILFLVASRPGRLPPTIRSRCRVIRIPGLSRDACHSVLTSLADGDDGSKEGSGDPSILTVLGEGAPGRALALASSNAVDCYMASCSLLAEDRLDETALAVICEKWGRGGAVGAASREGAIWLIGRMLSLAAVRAGTGEGGRGPSTIDPSNGPAVSNRLEV